jgi:hypothetical protein
MTATSAAAAATAPTPSAIAPGPPSSVILPSVDYRNAVAATVGVAAVTLP